MARLARVVVPGIPHHVTQRGVRSMPIFRHDRDRGFYLKLLKQHASEAGLGILAWCLMDNHIHIIALPSHRNSLARGIGETHRRYTLSINAEEKVRGHLFQERFHSCPLDEVHLVAAARYVLLNPVKAKLCRRPQDWPWSSANFLLGKTASDPLVTDRTLMGYVPVNQWRGLTDSKPRVSDDEILKFLRTGRPAGDGSFQQKLETATGRVLQMAKRGRPPVLGGDK